MAKIHYDPFKPSYDPYGEDRSEKGYCGTWLSEMEDNSTNNKKEVTCKKCKKLFKKAKSEMQMHSDNFAKDCEQFLEHQSK